MNRKNLWSVLAGLAAIWVLASWRGLFLQHAIIAGIAIAALVYILLRTIERLRELHGTTSVGTEDESADSPPEWK